MDEKKWSPDALACLDSDLHKRGLLGTGSGVSSVLRSSVTAAGAETESQGKV